MPKSHYEFSFDKSAFSVVAGGESTLDQTHLNINNFDDADSFIKSYGFDYSLEPDQERLWYFHRRALVLITERLKYSVDEIPEEIRSPELLKDLRNLLIWSSYSVPLQKNKSDHQNKLQRWSCALLRCMHVFIHSETDLFNNFSEEIQKQIMGPIEAAISHADKLYLTSLEEKIEIFKFEAKPYKASQSAVIKLLAKPDTSALTVFDKIGFRFVAMNLFDAFRVIRFFVRENLISFAHIMPDQSSNTMFPIKEFLEFCELQISRSKVHKRSEIVEDQELIQFLRGHENKFLNFFRKENSFSAQEFKYIKFICRRLIRVPMQSADKTVKDFRFFYPFEVQIMTKDVYNHIQTGDSEHTAYKNRQIEAARKRILPE